MISLIGALLAELNLADEFVSLVRLIDLILFGWM